MEIRNFLIINENQKDKNTFNRLQSELEINIFVLFNRRNILFYHIPKYFYAKILYSNFFKLSHFKIL